LTVLDIGIIEPEMLTDETGGNDAERCLVENQMASDFSGLSARPLKRTVADIHLTNTLVVSSTWNGGQTVNTICCTWTRWILHIISD